MATFTNMVARVRNALRDSEAVFITDAMIGEWINEAYLDLCARLPLLRKDATGTTSSTGTITLPADFISLLSLRIDDTSGDTFVTPIYATDDIFLSYRSPDVIPAPTLYRIWEGVIETWPEQQSLTYYMEYAYKPDELSGSDEPVIAEELHVRLVNYARAHAKLIEGETEESDRYMSLYIEGLPTAPTSMRRERPGPFNLVPEPNYWDVS
jgi:hypothetical protein